MGGESNANSPTTDTAATPARVVVLVPKDPDATATAAGSASSSGPALPAALLNVLGRKGLEASVVHDAPAVMVELARRPARAVVVCLSGVSDAALSRADDLMRAVARYHPAAARWAYHADPPRPRLTAWSPDPHASQDPSPKTAPPAAPSKEPRFADATGDAPGPRPEVTAAQREPAASAAPSPTPPEDVSDPSTQAPPHHPHDTPPGPPGDHPATPTQLAEAVERATWEQAGPRLRLAGVEDDEPESTADHKPVPPEERRRRARRARRRLGDLLGRARQPQAKQTAAAGMKPSPAPSEGEPLLSREEIDMLLGPGDESDPASSRSDGTSG